MVSGGSLPAMVESGHERVTLLLGDCTALMPTLAAGSVDSIVCDPPYHLTSIVKRFGAKNAKAARRKQTGAYARASAGFMGQTWDGGDVAFRVETWRAAFRVLKPGGHLVAFSGSRTVHRMAVAIEDAGFEIRDGLRFYEESCAAASRFVESLDEAQQDALAKLLDEQGFGGELQWLYGSGFPKSHDVAKDIDKRGGYWRGRAGPAVDGDAKRAMGRHYRRTDKGCPVLDAARQWEGWGTALKPAFEPIVLARKPVSETSVAANVLMHGTGAINVDGCKIPAEVQTGWGGKAAGGGTWNGDNCGLAKDGEARPSEGRWPANVLLDGSDEVVGAFPDAAGALRAVDESFAPKAGTAVYGDYGPRPAAAPRGDSGSAARFFYSAKADADDRLGSKHPTVKPVELMRWLVRLTTPPGGVVLDPFAGSGSTGVAAVAEGMRAVLIEQSPDYADDIQRRLARLSGGGGHKMAEKQRNRTVAEAGPLFAAKAGEGAG